MRLWTFLLLCLAVPILLGHKPAHYIVGLPDTQLYPQYWNDEGKLAGYVPALIRQFAADEGMVLDLEFYPIRRYLVEFQEGRIDFIVPSNPGWGEGSSSQAMTFSIPFMQSRAGFIGLDPKLHPSKINSITTLAGYTVAVLFEKDCEFKGVKLEYVNSVNSAMRVLMAKRTDLVYLHFDAAEEWIRLNPKVKTSFYFYDQYARLMDYHLGTMKHPKIIERFNRWMQKHPEALEQAKASVGQGKRPRAEKS
ncbi:substrate-binding periplasmic protein [Oligoflexus tunisiensis]|uniref:substrate-binding periplasmic protein n=1 Tax=Oligoflexus tunisiensis TaxID=708132 RepID=UPI00114D1AED|nr:transporter substrate-binding domain-containing protein [Oligoflexus tunisiensis]